MAVLVQNNDGTTDSYGSGYAVVQDDNSLIVYDDNGNPVQTYASGMWAGVTQSSSGTAVTAGVQCSAASLMSGNDQAGRISITAVNSPSAGALVAVTFFVSYSTPPAITVQVEGNNAAATLAVSQVPASDGSGFTVYSDAVPVGNQSYTIDYVVNSTT